jgi:hypothetical protein
MSPRDPLRGMSRHAAAGVHSSTLMKHWLACGSCWGCLACLDQAGARSLLSALSKLVVLLRTRVRRLSVDHTA